MIGLRPALALLLLALFSGRILAQGFAGDVDALPTPVGTVALRVDEPPGDYALLDVGVVILDPGIPADTASHGEGGIFPEIRRAEARYLPVLLRDALIDAGNWGAVRVLPEAMASAELLVTGEILASDGMSLTLRLRAADATGRTWLDRIYRDEAREADYPVAPGADPFADLYRQVANDLLAARERLGERQLLQIRQVALLRFASELSPEAFSSYLRRDGSGDYVALRLPAEGDPMIARVERIRNQEFLFIDTVDEQYTALFEEMAPTYSLWRQFLRESAIFRAQYEARVLARDSDARRGSFAAMQEVYDAYKWSRIHAQDLDELAQGFDNEVAPTVIEVSGRVYRLNGALDAQYGEWRQILREIFALETGLPITTR
jgi:hypothetical protein